MALASCSRSVALTRSLNSASFSPSSGRNPHWFRKSAVRFRYSAMSSSGMPLATRLPTNGGTNSGLSVATSERAGWPSTGDVSGSSSRLRLGTLRSEISRPKSGSSSPFVLSSTSRSIVRSPSKASRP